MSKGLGNVSCVLLVLSGKGGVGKSTFSAQLSLCLSNSGHKVGLLDVDLCGPSLPTLFNITNPEVSSNESGWLPININTESGSLSVLSIGFLLPERDDAVIWRGPKKTALIKQFLTQVFWGDLDVLIIDTPPGTSDEHLALLEVLQSESLVDLRAIIVTTPQALSLLDVAKELSFCEKTNIKVCGIIENMSNYECPHCAHCAPILSQTGGGESLSKAYSVPFIGSLPVDPTLISNHNCILKSKSYKALQNLIRGGHDLLKGKADIPKQIK